MKHGKNQQRKGHLKHLENKRERQRHELATRPATRPQSIFQDAPGWIQKEYIEMQRRLEREHTLEGERAEAAYKAGVVRGYLGQVRDLLLRRMDDMNVAAFDADKAAGKDVSVIIFNKPDEVEGDFEVEDMGETSDAFQVDDKPATPTEVRKMVAAATQAPVTVVCPLCNHPITLDDAVTNSTVVKLNGQPVQVHKNCPGEGPVKPVKSKNSHKGEKNG